MEYNLKIDEIMALICGSDGKGCSEEEIQKVEENISIRLPEIHRNYLKVYGGERINQILHQIFEPRDIRTSYESIEEIIQELEFEEMSEEEIEENEDNPYYILYKLQKEKWHTVTENYVYIGCENQGVWFAGYLLKDLQDKKSNPPIYMTVDDDDITFVKAYDNVENFLWSMIGEALIEYALGIDKDEESITGMWKDLEGINGILEKAHIDKDKLKNKINETEGMESFYVGNCVDREGERVYFYYEFKKYTHLVVLPFRIFQETK